MPTNIAVGFNKREQIKKKKKTPNKQDLLSNNLFFQSPQN